MPYPVETLPYPFRKRLRQLLTPFETLQFQKATGSFENKRYLLPVQKYQQCLKVVSRITDNNLTLSWCSDGSDQELPIEASCVYHPKHIHLHNLLEAQLSNSVFDIVLFDRADTLTLTDSTITESMLLALTSKKLKLTTFKRQFSGPEVFDEDALRLRAYFNAFPTMTECYRPCPAYEGWLQDLIEINKPDLKYFSIASDNFDKLFSYRLKEMVKLLKGQCSEFCLDLEYKVNDVTTIGLDHFSSLCGTVEDLINLNVHIRVYDDNFEQQYKYTIREDVQNASTDKTESYKITRNILVLVACFSVLLFVTSFIVYQIKKPLLTNQQY